MTDQNHPSAATSAANPFFEDWTGAFQVPPFGRITPEHFTPAFDRAFAEHDAEIAAIAGDAATPTFQNTIEAMERSGRPACPDQGVLWGAAGRHHQRCAAGGGAGVSPARAPPLERHPAQRAAV